jgi:hypothetical protein
VNDSLNEARRKLAESALEHILGGVAELRSVGAILPEPVADAISAIGFALHAGEDPMEVAVVCFALATALRNPENRDEIQRSAENVLKGMQARKAEKGT